MRKKQLHHRSTPEYVRHVLHEYCQGNLSRSEACTSLELKKTRFSELVKRYREDPQQFDIEYARKEANHTLPESTDDLIRKELEAELTSFIKMSAFKRLLTEILLFLQINRRDCFTNIPNFYRSSTFTDTTSFIFSHSLTTPPMSCCSGS